MGLEFHDLDDGLGIYDPVAEDWVKTAAEAAQARAEDAEERAEDAERTCRGTQKHAPLRKADARQQAESEVARLQAELERLKAGV